MAMTHRRRFGLLATAVSAVVLITPYFHKEQSESISVQAVTERIVSPSSPCYVDKPTSAYQITSENYRVASSSHRFTPSLKYVASKLIDDMTSPLGVGVRYVNGVELTAKREIVFLSNSPNNFELRVVYPSEFVNVESWGETIPMNRFDGRSDDWRITVPENFASTFGAPQSLAVGEVYYDVHTQGAPVLCITKEIASTDGAKRVFLGRKVSDPKSSFLLIQAGAATSNCTTYGTKNSEGKYQGLVCPASLKVESTYSAKASISRTVKKGTKSVKQTNTMKLSIEFDDSSAYIYCKTNAICKKVGSNLTPNPYKDFSEYESTFSQYWLNPRLELSVQYAAAWSPELDKHSWDLNMPLPWCAAFSAFLTCSVVLEATISTEIALNAAGTLTMWGLRPYVASKSKKWKYSATGEDGSSMKFDATLLEPYSANKYSSTLSVVVSAPILSIGVGLKVATTGDLIWAKGSIEGSVWREVEIVASPASFTVSECGSLDAIAEAGVGPWTDSVSYNLISSC